MSENILNQIADDAPILAREARDRAKCGMAPSAEMNKLGVIHIFEVEFMRGMANARDAAERFVIEHQDQVFSKENPAWLAVDNFKEREGVYA